MKELRLVFQVRSWFMVAFFAKVVCAYASYKLGDAVWTGFWLPIFIMVAYVVIGYGVRQRFDFRLTISKFADSVYYLGFLFTVGSIIVCLADIQSVGDNLSGMAGRFSAAMVSTALGMVARTYLVGFKTDPSDSIASVEERAIDASERLILMFEDTYSKLDQFRDEVVGATKETMSAAKEQIQELSKHSVNAMDAYFANATLRSNEAFDIMLKDARNASDDLLSTINGLSEKSEQTLERMEAHALDFGNLAQRRLEQTLFPDDLFSTKLQPSIDTLARTSEGVNDSIFALADDVKAAARSVGTAIRALNTKSQILADTLNSVGAIVESQQRLMDAMNGQGNTMLEGVDRVQKEFINSLASYQQGFYSEVSANREVVEKIVSRLQSLSEKIAEDDTAEVLGKEIKENFHALGRITERANEAFSDSIKSTLLPLIQVVADSNETHKGLAAQLVSGNRSIEIAHAQLDELIEKIEHVNQIESRRISASLDNSKSHDDLADALDEQHKSSEMRPA